MNQSCSQILGGNGFNQTPPNGGGSGTQNPFNSLIAKIVNFDNTNFTIDSTGSVGNEVRAIIKRAGNIIETTPVETNTGSNQIPFTVTLENGDELCVEVSNDSFTTIEEDCIFIPSPAFAFMDACPIILIEQILINGDISINIDGATTTLTTTISPTEAAIQNLIWTSSNPSIATVNQQGVVTPRDNGEVTIYATANDGSGIIGDHILTLSNQTSNQLLISDIAPQGVTIIQYDDLIGLEENQIEFFRDGDIAPSNSYDLNPLTGVITLLVNGDIFEGEDIEIRLI